MGSRTYINGLRPCPFLQRRFGVRKLEHNSAAIDILRRDLARIHGVSAVQSRHIPRQLNRVVDGSQAETAALRLHHLTLLVCTRPQRRDARRLLAKLDSERLRGGVVDDLNDLVVVFREMVKERSIGNTALVFRRTGRGQSNVLQEFALVVQLDEL